MATLFILQIGCFAENLVGSSFLSVFNIKSIPAHKKTFAVGENGPNVILNLLILGLGWPRVGEFVGFVIIFVCFPTQQNLVNRKHRTNEGCAYCNPNPFVGYTVLSILSILYSVY